MGRAGSLSRPFRRRGVRRSAPTKIMHRIRRFQVPRTSHRSAGFVNAILELSIPEVRFLRRYSVENRLSHKTFGVHNLVNLANDRFRLFLWDDDYAVDIGKDKVTRADLDALDLNRLAKGFERPGAGDVPGVWNLANTGKFSFRINALSRQPPSTM